MMYRCFLYRFLSAPLAIICRSLYKYVNSIIIIFILIAFLLLIF
jgi:hypothetical protein